MGKHQKKTTERKKAPVPTGHDYRGKERAENVTPREHADAPDGISGPWD